MPGEGAKLFQGERWSPPRRQHRILVWFVPLVAVMTESRLRCAQQNQGHRTADARERTSVTASQDKSRMSQRRDAQYTDIPGCGGGGGEGGGGGWWGGKFVKSGGSRGANPSPEPPIK